MKKVFFAMAVCLWLGSLLEGQTLPSATGPVQVIGSNTVHLMPPFSPPPTGPDPSPPPPTGTPDGPDRGIFWVHGLTKPQGATGAWLKPSVATQNGAPGFAARRVKSFRPTFTQASTLVAAGTSLDAAIRSSVTGAAGTMTSDVDQHFIIAHSLGGIVSRQADQLVANGTFANQPYGGIVTFGTPHAGAQIGNTVSIIENEFSDMCQEATDPIGPTFHFIPQTTINALGIVISIIDDPVCTWLPAKFSDFKQPILADFASGAPGITALNAGPINIGQERRVAFVGIENEEVLWREFHHIQNPAAGYPLFGANDSQLGQNTIITVRGVYAAAANALDFWPIRWLSDEWQEGLDALTNINGIYKSLIGATNTAVTGSNQYCQCTMTTNYGYGPVTQTYNQSGAIQSTCASSSITPTGSVTCQWVTDLITTTTIEPNDGVVIQSTQQAFPGCQQFGTMIGSNHQSMRNDSNTRSRLLSLFTGGHGLYFATLLR